MKCKSCLVVVAIGLIVVALSVAGCVSTNSVLLNASATRYAPISPDLVRIFTAESELDTLEYVRVAMIEATGSGTYTSQTDMYKAIRRKAGSLGCNGVLLPQINEPGAGAKVAATIFNTDTQRKGNAIAIRILGKKEKQPSQ
jgi:hypothetical protein